MCVCHALLKMSLLLQRYINVAAQNLKRNFTSAPPHFRPRLKKTEKYHVTAHKRYKLLVLVIHFQKYSITVIKGSLPEFSQLYTFYFDLHG